MNSEQHLDSFSCLRKYCSFSSLVLVIRKREREREEKKEDDCSSTDRLSLSLFLSMFH